MEILLVIVILAAAFGVRIYGPTFFTQRALKKVIKIFKEQGATSNNSAKPQDQLKLTAKTGGIRYTRTGEYRQKALEALLQTELVKSNDDGNLYLHIENLLASRLVERWPELAEGLSQEDEGESV